MPQIILYIAASVDGYIADSGGGVGWLPSGDGGSGGDDYGYAAFYAGVDAVAMGRRTYEQVRGFGVPWPYPGKPVYVFTNRTADDNDGGVYGDGGGRPPEVEFIRSDAGAFVRDIAGRYAGIVWLVGGADLAEQFRAAGLIDEYRVFVIPVILGRGVPLFAGDCDAEGGAPPTALRLEETQAFADGVAMLRYRPQGQPAGTE